MDERRNARLLAVNARALSPRRVGEFTLSLPRIVFLMLPRIASGTLGGALTPYARLR